MNQLALAVSIVSMNLSLVVDIVNLPGIADPVEMVLFPYQVFDNDDVPEIDSHCYILHNID